MGDVHEGVGLEIVSSKGILIDSDTVVKSTSADVNESISDDRVGVALSTVAEEGFLKTSRDDSIWARIYYTLNKNCYR